MLVFEKQHVVTHHLSPAPQHWHGNNMNEGGCRRNVLLSTVCTHTVLWSIMHVWWYVMLLVIATILISFYHSYHIFFFILLLLFFFSGAPLLMFFLLFFTLLFFSLTFILSLPPLLLFSSIATCLQPPSSFELSILSFHLPSPSLIMYSSSAHLSWHVSATFTFCMS